MMQSESVGILTAGVVLNPYSQEVSEDWGSPTEITVATLAPAEPRPSVEPVQDARNAVVSGWTLYLPSGTAVTSANRVRVRGTIYPVQGKPADWMGAGIVVQAFGTVG